MSVINLLFACQCYWADNYAITINFEFQLRGTKASERNPRRDSLFWFEVFLKVMTRCNSLNYLFTIFGDVLRLSLFKVICPFV